MRNQLVNDGIHVYAIAANKSFLLNDQSQHPPSNLIVFHST